ncbi:MAG TPA: hypothetical protein VHE53_00155 [Patescibacteria group bacterium]|nr:hypothetical protein [Patescibacteria group bacterium]
MPFLDRKILSPNIHTPAQEMVEYRKLDPLSPEAKKLLVNLFERRIAAMKPSGEDVSTEYKSPLSLGIDEEGFGNIAKFTDLLVLTHLRDGVLVAMDFLVDDREKSGPKGHYDIDKDYRYLRYMNKNKKIRGAFVEDENGKRGVILDTYELNQVLSTIPDPQQRIDLLSSTIDEFGVDVLLGGDGPRHVDESGNPLLVRGSTYEELIRSRQIQRFAQNKGYSNAEHMRFRLSGQTPDEFENK